MATICAGFAGRLIEAARDGAEDLVVDARLARDGILADLREIRVLPLVLPGNPAPPFLIERRAEHFLELRGEVAFASRGAIDPLDHFLRTVLHRQIAHETCAIEVRVLSDLKIDRRPFRLQSDDVVEERVFIDHRAEDHLVVSAESAADAAGHPRLQKHRNPLVIPPRRIPARAGQVAVHHRQRLFFDRRDFAVEEPAKLQIAVRRLVGGDDVDQLVMHQPVHPLVRRHHVIDVVERLDSDADVIPRNRGGAAVAVVAEVLHQDDHRLGGRVIEKLVIEGQGVFEGTRQVIGQIFVRFIVIN